MILLIRAFIINHIIIIRILLIPILHYFVNLFTVINPKFSNDSTLL